MKFLIALLYVFIIHSNAVAEDLRMYHKETVHEHYYDKGSIMYPNRNIVTNKPDKSIVEVWEIRKNISTNGIKKTLKRINCDSRQINAKQIIENGTINYSPDLYMKSVVQPNTADYYLFNDLCIHSRYR